MTNRLSKVRNGILMITFLPKWSDSNQKPSYLNKCTVNKVGPWTLHENHGREKLVLIENVFFLNHTVMLADVLLWEFLTKSILT